MSERDIHLEIGDLKLQVTRGTQLPAPGFEKSMPAAIPAAPTHQTETNAAPLKPLAKPFVPAGHVAVCAPTIGTFYRASAPGAKPFVEIGDHVGPDDIVCVFDVMKLFSGYKSVLLPGGKYPNPS